MNQVVRMQHVRNRGTSVDAVAAHLIGRLAEDAHRAGERFRAWPTVTGEYFNEVGYNVDTGPEFEIVEPDLAQYLRVHVAVDSIPRLR